MAAPSPSNSPSERPARKGSVLIVDDDQGMCEMLSLDLKRRGYRVEWRNTPDDALALIRDGAHSFDVVVTDLNLGRKSGVELTRTLAAERPELPVIIVTGFGSIETAVNAIRTGAYDFITKPFELDQLSLSLERAIDHHALKREVARLQRAVADAQGFGELLGESAPMKAIYKLLARVADSDATVLVTGESGTGKELVARALHSRSRRASGPFVALNCGAVPEQLLESELFGHVKGAFTDARFERTGVFREADRGTLFLDEIAELPLGLQPKLLRAIQERTVRPVGATKEIPFDARIVAATNRNLEADVEAGRFRKDLYYRLNVVNVDLPPLRARGTDALLLAQAFLQRLAERAGQKPRTLSRDAAQALVSYAWPGNVRELQNCMERAMALTGHEVVELDDLSERIRARPAMPLPDVAAPGAMLPMDEIERRYILSVLEQVKGNKRRAAMVLGFDRTTLYRKLRLYGTAIGKEDKD